jgi:hypothetical protein
VVGSGGYLVDEAHHTLGQRGVLILDERGDSRNE